MSTDLAQCAYWTAVPWPPAVASAMMPSISSVASASRPRSPASAIAACGAMRVPVASLTASTSAISSAARREVAAERGGLTARVVRDGERLERPGVAGELHRARADLEAAVVVPQEVRRPRRQPAPPEHLLRGDLGARERGDRAPEHAALRRGAPR